MTGHDHGARTWGDPPRCADCGHRVSANGVAPIASRVLALRNPGYVITELAGRRAARRAGRILTTARGAA